VCATCTTHDCIRGNASRRGCELDLFLPRKVGNLDCTFCLDCVHACPHDNIGLLATSPASSLVFDGRRSSIGRLARRLDLAALALLLVLAAFVMAAAMVAPVSSPVLLALLAAPPLAVAGLAAAPPAVRERTCRFVLALVPLGFTCGRRTSSFTWCADGAAWCSPRAGARRPRRGRGAALVCRPAHWVPVACSVSSCCSSTPACC
jgi:hypothetical protein